MNPSSTAVQPRKKTGSFSGDKVPSGYKTGQLQQYTPEALDLYGQMFSHVGRDSYLNRLSSGDEDLFNEIEAPAHRQFQEMLGGLGTRFSIGGGEGSLGTRRSSGFQNEASARTSNFAQDLQSKRQDLMRQALKDLAGISGELLDKRPYERFLEKKEHKPKWWESLLGTISPIAGDIYEGGTRNTSNFVNAFSGGGSGGYKPTGNEWK